MKIKELKLNVTTCYLIAVGDKYVLIDTGYEFDWELFCKRLKEAGVGFSDISHLVLTHHHDDHSGLLCSVVEANKDIQIVMSCRGPAFLAKGHNDRTHGVGYVSRGARMALSLAQKLNKTFARQWQTHAFPHTYPEKAIS